MSTHEIDRLRRETDAIADVIREDAPETAGYLDGIADDFIEARAMLADERGRQDGGGASP